MDIDGSIGNRVVAHHVSDSIQRNILMIHFGGKSVSEHTWCDSGFYAGLFGLVFDNALHAVIGYGGIGLAGEKRVEFFTRR